MKDEMNYIEKDGVLYPDIEMPEQKEMGKWGLLNHFVDSARGLTICINTADVGIALMKLLMAICESTATGHEVVLSE